MSPTSQKFFDSLLPKRTGDAWLRIGEKSMIRGRHGVFELEVYTGGSHGNVDGLLGRFTSNEGAQNTLVFVFQELLEPCNAKKHPNYDNDAVLRHLRGWRNGGDCTWYVAQPKSLQPLHDAICAWMDVFDNR